MNEFNGIETNEVLQQPNENSLKVKKSFFNFSLSKLFVILLGFTAALCTLYFSIDTIYKPLIENIKLFTEQQQAGAQVSALSMIPIYIYLAIVSLFIICPVIASLLPKKFKNMAIILMMIPFSWKILEFLPSLVDIILYSIEYKEEYSQLIAMDEFKTQLRDLYLMLVATLSVLAASIIIALRGKEKKVKITPEISDDNDVVFYEISDETKEVVTEEVTEDNEEVITEEATEDNEEVIDESDEENL